MKQQVNILYSLSQGLYWMIYCVYLGYASVLLLDRDYSNTNIGFCLSIGFFLSIFVQQLVASIIDSHPKFNVVLALILFTSLLLVLSLFLQIYNKKSISMTCVFILISIIIMLLQPLLNSTNFFFINNSIYINFGFARSMGSLFYAIISMILGSLIAKHSTQLIPQVGSFFVFCFLIVNCLLFFITNKLNISYTKKSNPLVTSKTSIIVLFKTYKLFFLFLLGSLGLFLSHATINNYFYQIVINASGSTSDLGNIQAFSAICELPAMIFFNTIYKKFGCKRLLGIAAIFFTVKAYITLFASTIPLLYTSMICQMLAFAIFIPSSVYFVNEVIDKKDSVKGQSLVTVMITLANLISSLIGGYIIDTLSIKKMLIIACCFTSIGTLTVLWSLYLFKRKSTD